MNNEEIVKKDILLCSEQFVKNNTNMDDNVNSKLILTSIREAQEINLRDILGDNLLDKLKWIVAENLIEEEEYIAYKNLIKEIQFFLAYSTISNVCMMTSVKISNAGLEQVSDEHMQPISISDSYNIQDYYKKKADYFCMRLQNFILDNRKDYPELKESCLHKIKSNLYSSANTGLWLGGVRGNGFNCKIKARGREYDYYK